MHILDSHGDAGNFFAKWILVTIRCATASLVPTFDPKQQRFDQSTFTGRLSKMLLACDPSLVFYSSEEVRRCKAMVDGYESYLNNLPEGVSVTEMSRKLWEAQVCEAWLSISEEF